MTLQYYIEKHLDFVRMKSFISRGLSPFPVIEPRVTYILFLPGIKLIIIFSALRVIYFF